MQRHRNAMYARLALVAILSGGCATAGQPEHSPGDDLGQQPSDLTLDQILARHYEAIGGVERWRSLQGLKQTGRLSMAGVEAPFTSYTKRPNKQRAEFELQGTKGVQVFDGKQGWLVVPFMGTSEPQPMPQEMIDMMAPSSDIDGALVDHAADGHELMLLGKEDLGGKPAYRLHVRLRSGTEAEYLLDAEDFLTREIRSTTTYQGSPVAVVSRLGDYRQVSGLRIPHSMSSSGPMGEQVTRIDSVEVNPALDDALFTRPRSRPGGPAGSPPGGR